MNSVSVKSRDAASPWMVLLSVCLHAAGILAIVAVSFTISSPTKPLDPVVTPITVVSAPIGPPVMDTVASGPVESQADLPVPDVVEAPSPPKETSEAPRETVEQTKLIEPKAEPVSVPKRKKPPQRMAADKPPEKPKEPEKKKEIVQKKEDPKAYMEQKLAALREKLKNQKKDPATGPNVGPGGPSGQQGGAGADEESARWVNEVKRLVRAHWSLMGDARQIEKLRVTIGIKIAENGAVRGLTVDDSSGDQMFDNSAMRAVHQAAPFPPLPPQVNAEITRKGGLALNFTPRGIQ